MFEGKKYLGGIFKSWPLGFDHNRRFDDAWEKENKFSSNRSTLECQRAKKRGSLINGSFNWPLLVSRRYLGNSWLEILPSSLSLPLTCLLTWPVEWMNELRQNKSIFNRYLIDWSIDAFEVQASVPKNAISFHFLIPWNQAYGLDPIDHLKCHELLTHLVHFLGDDDKVAKRWKQKQATKKKIITTRKRMRCGRPANVCLSQILTDWPTPRFLLIWPFCF